MHVQSMLHFKCVTAQLLQILLQVVIEGTIQATGKSYVPTKAYFWVNLTQVQMNGKEVTTAVANNPAAKAADVNSSDANVKGEGSMDILPETMNIGRTYQLCHVTD